MRAAVTRAGVISVEDVDEPVPGDGQVLVATVACGICGSDLHVVAAQAARPELLANVVLGHEFVAEVLDFGPGTERRFAPGSFVTSVPYLDSSFGPQLVGLSPLAPGGLAERMVLQESRLLAVPASDDVERAAIAEPLAVGAHAVGVAKMQAGDVALVVGCGPVGLSVIASLKAGGFGPVVAADFSPGRRRLAESTGADVVVDPAVASPYGAWADLAGPALPASPLLDVPPRANTVVFECVGAPGVLAAVIDSASAHTRVVVVGACTEPDTITPSTAISKELSLQFVFAYRPEEFAQALRWIVDGVVDVGPWITGTCGLDGTADAFSQLLHPEDQCKILVAPGR
jgi:2-desacetyl-2-hydroxyethyl bacteriochlorophyllide A dehydrogenase